MGRAAPRPRGTLARCVFAWVAGGLAMLSVLVVAVGWGIGTLSAYSDAVPEWLLGVAWQAYIAGWLGVILATPFAGVAAVVAGGRQGRSAALGTGVWLLLLTLQSVVSLIIADTGPAPEWLDPLYAAAALLLMGVVPFAIAASTVLAGVWRWRSSAVAQVAAGE